MPKTKSTLLPGEYRMSGLVSVEMDSFRASLFAPDKLKVLQESRPGSLLEDSAAVIEDYIVRVHRLDGKFDYEIKHDGLTFRMPGEVFDRMASYREAIITRSRREAGRRGAETRRQNREEEVNEQEDPMDHLNM